VAAESGHGLMLVEALSHRWACRHLGARKVVWAEIALAAPPLPALSCAQPGPERVVLAS
jgi:hypothetical protein